MKLAHAWLASSLGMLLTSLPVSADPLIFVGRAQGIAGRTVNVAINFTTTDMELNGLQFDLLFNTNDLQVGAAVAGNAIPNPFFFFNMVSPGDLRVLSLAIPASPATNGVVANIPFTISANAPDNDEPLVFTNQQGTTAAGTAVLLSASNGVLSVTALPRFIQITPTNNGAIHLVLAVSTHRNFLIQAATNLAAPQWLSFTNIIAGTNPVFDDVSATKSPVRFYRALFAP